MSGLAHYHGKESETVTSTDGDQYLEAQPFTMVLSDDAGWWYYSPDGTYEGRYQFPETAEGKLFLYLAFGSYSDPASAQASFVTQANYNNGFFMSTADFADFFTLTKES